MIKLLKKYQIKLTPFDATKEWILSTTNNDDLLLVDTGSLEDDPVALEFVDYGSITSSLPSLDSLCDIALEQQDDDLVNIREGLKTTGIFYPEKDPINDDGTYKRVVYSQVNTMFYNHYGNPTEIFGLENIDFQVGKTKRTISDRIELLDVPTKIFGDKIIPGTITIVNSSVDNDYLIQDDSYGNLLAGRNIFSKQQEIGSYSNLFVTGSDSLCSNYFSFAVPSAPTSLTASRISTSSQVRLSWIDNSINEDGFVIERSINSGSIYSPIIYVGTGITSSIDTSISLSGSFSYRLYAYNSFGSSTYSNTSSLSI
jgi:hypothetical protein